ncbi:hypothetical protein TWF694_010292 [Orbilia ellipsospora]|uniref:chitinase n=1 Tax=Orbilia ellipsospora TaxID=2528407 RepID=A0AAV9XCI7_9PEZI
MRLPLLLSLCFIPSFCAAVAIWPPPPPPPPPKPPILAHGRSQVYVQTFTTPDGQPINLLQLLNQRTRVTHIYLASMHINEDPNDIHMNDYPPSAPLFDFVWPQVKKLQQNGVKVMMMLGGAAPGSYVRLSGTDEQFETYYRPLLAILRKYKIDGLDLDIEEWVDISVPLRLLRRLDKDLGPNFILTMAPVASGLLPQYAYSLSGFDYLELDKQAVSRTRPGGKLVNWYNCQFYNGWGDATSQEFYNSIAGPGGAFDPSRVVLGVLVNPDLGWGYVPVAQLTDVIHQLRTTYPTFGGVIGWEYFDAGLSEGITEPALWVKAISNALFNPLTPVSVDHSTSNKPKISPPWPGPMNTLQGKGVGYFPALRALNMTGGDLGRAESLVLPGH